jgi:predicted TPR repeat methyltransferase
MVATKLQGGNQTEAAESAIRKITAILKKNQNIASGYLLLGHLNKAVGKLESAAKCFEKVLEYDPSNVEATREVRLSNMRKAKGKKKGLFGL